MTRFIMVNDRLVSVDHIVTVAECDNGDTKLPWITAVLTAPSSQELDQAIMGCHHVVAVIPCHGWMPDARPGPRGILQPWRQWC